MSQDLIRYCLATADNALILGQRNAEWCGHGPVLEQDIAITNISLDLIGQARLFYQYAAELIGDTDEDKLAFLRTEREFNNVLLVELPVNDWAYTTLRQFFFSQYQQLLFEQLSRHSDPQIAAIAQKTKKEVDYHVTWSRDWVIRLGDGTTESHERIQYALTDWWGYTGELFKATDYETSIIGTLLTDIYTKWHEAVEATLQEATLLMPEKTFMHKGGKSGIHTEHMGRLLAEMQYMQRTYPNSQW